MTVSEAESLKPSCARPDTDLSWDMTCTVLEETPYFDYGFELSLTVYTWPQLVKGITYFFPADGSTFTAMVKNVVMQYGFGNPRPCIPPPMGAVPSCNQWALEDGAYLQLRQSVFPERMNLYLSAPRWLNNLDKQEYEKKLQHIRPPRF